MNQGTAPAARLTRKESQAATRKRLIDSAIELFARDGVAGTSLNAVAEHAGFSRGAVHGNFSGKDELAAAVTESVIGALAPELQRVLSGPEPAGDRLAAYIRTFLEYCAQQPEAAAALIAVVEHAGRQQPRYYSDRAAASIGDLVALFEEGQATGEMRVFDTRTMAFAVRTVLDGAALRLIADQAGAAELADEIAAMFIAATRKEVPA
ncbi:TetR/AcrR family transcriptional regulator [Glycomyces sp. MUSA5-2]|uniref:TetR/AcrR family transcriptional regulator n=1 Tax=Glycomyces sp. MUSA5-2 TaxID=2053002 RepID=UPI003007F6D8